MLSYRAVLKESWKISWKNKYLWFFGFFASLISFNIEFKVLARSLDQSSGLNAIANIKTFLSTGLFSQNAWLNFIELLKTDTVTISWLIFIFLLILAIIIFLAWLSTVSQIGIIDSVNKIMKGSREKLGIKSGLKSGRKKFWPVLALNVIISLSINLIYFLISWLLVSVAQSGQMSAVLAFGLIFIIMVPLSLALSFVIKYTIAYAIIENKKLTSAIKLGWKLFKQNWLVSVEMAIVLFLINILSIILLSFLSLTLFYLAFGLALSMMMLSASSFLFWSLVVLGFLIVLALIIMIGSLLNTFQIASWTNLFVRLKKEKELGKLERIFQE